METTLVVAIIAALASGVGAVLASRSAHRARQGADRINSVNHQIAVIDRHAEELRNAYAAVVDSLTRLDKTAASTMGPIAALELLIACRGADSEIEEHSETLQGHFAQKNVDGMGKALTSLRGAYSACQSTLEEQRASLLNQVKV
jgi:hypothetical protein